MSVPGAAFTVIGSAVWRSWRRMVPAADSMRTSTSDRSGTWVPSGRVSLKSRRLSTLASSPPAKRSHTGISRRSPRNSRSGAPRSAIAM